MSSKILIALRCSLIFAIMNILMSSRHLNMFGYESFTNIYNNSTMSVSSSVFTYYDDEDTVEENTMIIDAALSTNAETRGDVEIGKLLAQPNNATIERFIVNDDTCEIRQKFHGLKKNEPPRTDFKGKLVYMTMGGASYIPYLEIFVQTLINFQIKQENIGVVCIDEECSRHIRKSYPDIVLQEYIHQINGTNCQRNTILSDVRCRVSMGKAELILGHLQAGNAVYFVDADVFFYRHPYKSIRVQNAALDMHVQTDGHAACNFDLFLVSRDVFGRNLCGIR